MNFWDLKDKAETSKHIDRIHIGSGLLEDMRRWWMAWNVVQNLDMEEMVKIVKHLPC